MLPTNNKKLKIDLTAAAFEQIRLIQENDYTLEGLNFRLQIDGKGCDGFTYATGFSEKVDKDLILEFEYKNNKLNILIDPFCAFYCKEGILDYLIRPKDNDEGFVFENANEDQHHGKFFKDGENVPTTKDLQ